MHSLLPAKLLLLIRSRRIALERQDAFLEPSPHLSLH
ncbi:MAG: Uncharacterised protein [Cyanobium sp. ARS6]|nr:MAG: Uncharacterised protein [Cyanobium sp. ARS6]